MANVKIVDHGSFKNAFAYLHYLRDRKYLEHMHEYGQLGVEILSQATPKDTGLTSESWTYEVRYGARKSEIIWRNTNLTSQGDSIAILLQYGHGTGTGGYVRGIDYINPALKSVFEQFLVELEQAVKSL